MPRILLLLLVGLALSACTDSLTGPDDGDEPPVDEPPIQTRTVYDLDIDVSPYAVEVVGSCDQVFGQPTAGEFQYRFEFAGHGDAYSQETQDFDSRFGVVQGRVAGQYMDVSRATYSWRGLDARGGITATIIGTEWDGAVRDGDMSRRAGTRDVPSGLGSRNTTVTIGATSDCRLVLAYSVEWRAREVPV